MAIDLLDPTRRDVARIERAAADAIGPDEEVVLDGWRLRVNAGVTRRANSALPPLHGVPSHDMPAPLATSRRVAAVARFYRERGMEPRMQLSVAAPTGLDVRLHRAGWVRETGAVVMVGPTSAAGQAAGDARSGDARSGDAPRSIVVSDRPSEAWLSLQDVVTPGRRAWARRRAEALARLGRTAWHAVVHDDEGRPVASGLGVLDRRAGLVGLFAFATVPEARRRGHARRLVRTLLERGGRAGARQAYLQVHPENAEALSLYDSLGFREHHRYHYRRAPAQD